jgi:hypothetical protein
MRAASTLSSTTRTRNGRDAAVTAGATDGAGRPTSAARDSRTTTDVRVLGRVVEQVPNTWTRRIGSARAVF